MTKISVIENFLEPDLFFHATTLSNEIYNSSDGSLKSNASWNADVVRTSHTVLVHMISDDKLMNYLQKRIEEEFGDYDITPMFYYWTQMSYIPWHNDGGHHAAMTIYLSDHEENDGGYFMYEKSDGTIEAIQPKYNRAIFQSDKVRHSVTSVNLGAPVRRTIQIFMKKRLTN